MVYDQHAVLFLISNLKVTNHKCNNGSLICPMLSSFNALSFLVRVIIRHSCAPFTIQAQKRRSTHPSICAAKNKVNGPLGSGTKR